MPIGDNERVHAHLGTTHVLARVARIGDRFAQLRLNREVVATGGDYAESTAISRWYAEHVLSEIYR